MKKGFSTVFMVLQCLVIAYCALACIYTIISGGGTGAQRTPAIFTLAALIATALYAFRGYKKSSAQMYRAMLLLCALASLMCIVPLLYNTSMAAEEPFVTTVCALGSAVCFGLYLLLAYVPDLGKKKTFLLIAAIFVIEAAIYIYTQIRHPGIIVADGTEADTMRIMRCSAMVELAVATGICAWFKYRDKAARGSK